MNRRYNFGVHYAELIKTSTILRRLSTFNHFMNGHQISVRFMYALFGYDVTCDVTKSFSKSITRFSQDLLSSYTCMSALCI